MECNMVVDALINLQKRSPNKTVFGEYWLIETCKVVDVRKLS